MPYVTRTELEKDLDVTKKALAKRDEEVEELRSTLEQEVNKPVKPADHSSCVKVQKDLTAQLESVKARLAAAKAAPPPAAPPPVAQPAPLPSAGPVKTVTLTLLYKRDNETRHENIPLQEAFGRALDASKDPLFRGAVVE